MSETNTAPSAQMAGLKRLDKFVGAWKIGGDVEGESVYEWMEGHRFLIHRGKMKSDDSTYSFMEIIGYDQEPGATKPAEYITSRLYTSKGETLNYICETDDTALTIWYGAKGSPSFCKLTWSEDDNSLTGSWEWPAGGYKFTMTRAEDVIKKERKS
jgi:hypothetical protein